MTVKEVTVALTEADIKKTEPRRRRTRKVGGQTVDINTEAPSGTPSGTPTAPTTPTPTPAISASPPTASVTPAVPETPAVITTTANTQATITTTATTTIAQPPSTQLALSTQTGGVQIKTRKRTHGSLLPPTPVPSKPLAARILPIKRHAMPSKEKPKLQVPRKVGGQAETPTPVVSTPAVPAVPTVPTPPTTDATVPAPTNTQATATATAPTATTGGAKRAVKRRFTERRIGISVRSLKTTRKARKSIRKQVASMSVPEIRKILTEKGLLKGKTNPPEAMLRSLMKDYLSLKH